MIGRRVDIRYARAVYENAKEEQVQGAVYQDMVELIYLYINVPDFKKFVENPAIKPAQKGHILHKIFDGKFNKLTLAFLMLILRKSRLANILGIAKAYGELYRSENNIQTVRVYTAREMNENLKALLKEKLESLLDKEVVFWYRVQPELIGGLKIDFDSQEYDASILSKLTKLRREFDSNPHLSQL